MQEKRTKPGEKAKHDLNEKTTYRFRQQVVYC